MARWNDVSSYANLAVAEMDDADLVPIADVSLAEGSRQKTATIAALKAVLRSLATVAVVDPVVTDDSSDGFAVGSLWYNEGAGNEELFIATDVTEGAAVWESLLNPSAVGDVVGPASAVDDRIATFDGITGKLLQDGGKVIADLVAVTDPVTINDQSGTTYPLVLADVGKLVTLANAAAITLTVPTNAAVAFPVGTIIALQQMGVGAVSVAGDTGVTINGTTPGSETLTNAQYLTTATLTKHGTDVWTLTGAVA